MAGQNAIDSLLARFGSFWYRTRRVASSGTSPPFWTTEVLGLPKDTKIHANGESPSEALLGAEERLVEWAVAVSSRDG